MNVPSELSLVEVLQKSLSYDRKDVEPLLKYLGFDESNLDFKKDSNRADAGKIAAYFRKMGSNDIATLFRDGAGVSYDEIVYDVGRKLKVKGILEDAKTSENEELIIQKLFSDALDKMTEEERFQLMGSLGISSKSIPYAAAGAAITQVLLRELGGFAIYKGAVTVANLVAKSLLGTGLSFATNAAITRVVAAAVGPIGWIVSGAWLAVDLAGPAFRKTVPAVVHIAMLRQIVMKRVVVGVVGEGSVGKDSLLKATFGIDTNNINPVAGSTSTVEIFNWAPKDGDEPNDITRVINFPGFNDLDEKINELTEDHLNHSDLFIMVVDVNRGSNGTDVSQLKKLKERGRPILVCLNKVDLPRPGDKEKLINAAKDRLSGNNVYFVETAFDPDPRLIHSGPIGFEETKNWVISQLREAGKDI